MHISDALHAELSMDDRRKVLTEWTDHADEVAETLVQAQYADAPEYLPTPAYLAVLEAGRALEALRDTLEAEARRLAEDAAAEAAAR